MSVSLKFCGVPSFRQVRPEFGHASLIADRRRRYENSNQANGKHVAMTCRSQVCGLSDRRDLRPRYRVPNVEAVICAGRKASRCYVIDVNHYVTTTALPLSVSRHLALKRACSIGHNGSRPVQTSNDGLRGLVVTDLRAGQFTKISVASAVQM